MQSKDSQTNPRRPVVEIIDPMMVEILRRKTPEQRLAQAFGMWDTAILVVNAAVRQQRPELSPAEMQREVFRRIRGTDAP